MSDKIYDLEPLNALVDGNEKFRKYLIELFIQTTPPILNDLKRSFENHDLEGIYAHAHKIKPTLDSMGMVSLRPVIQELMTIAKHKIKNENLDGLVMKLLDKVHLAIDQLQNNEL